MSKPVTLNIANLVIGENEQEIKDMLCDLIQHNEIKYLVWDALVNNSDDVFEVLFTTGLTLKGDWKLGGKKDE